jgi:hypothetical protein
MDRAKPLQPLLHLSLVMAAASFFAGLFALSGVTGSTRFPGQDLLLAGSFGLSIAWAISLVVGVVTRRWRGLWLLIGLPLALAYPSVILALALPGIIR